MDNQVEKIQLMTEQGFSARKISFSLKLDFELVRNIIKENNFSLKKEMYNESKKEEIMNLYNSGISAKVLSNKYNTRKARIIGWAKEAGTFRDANISHRIHCVNENAFDKIETPEQAYWLGFLYADAYNCELIDCVRLGLKEDDKSHIMKYVEFMSGDPSHVKFTKNSMGNSLNYNINSKYLSKKLKELGCPQAKSFIITYPQWLDKKLTFHFIRGLFDGDGCLTFKKNIREWHWSIVGTQDLCVNIKNIFTEYDIETHITYISETGNNTYQVGSSGNLKIEKILNLIYKDSSIYLDRKYQKYNELLDFNQKRRDRKFATIIKINNQEMNTKYFSNSTDENEKLIDPIADYFNNLGFVYPDDHEKIIREYNLLCKYKPDIAINELNNNSRLGTYICKYFCSSFYNGRSFGLPSQVEAYNIENIKKIVKLKITSDKLSKNFSPQTILDGMKDYHISAPISIFKPEIAKYMYEKYSSIGDTVGDYSCGFGGRLLGAVSCGRKYIGTDPLTTLELQKMVDYFSFKDVNLINLGSEYYCGEENSIDLYWSSPPYFDLEKYSHSENQAYNKGENYFYNIYWKKTLENVKKMLKPGKWFGINVNDANYKMVEIAKEYFGEIAEEVSLVSKRNHFAGKTEKIEKIYMFKNIK